MIERATRKLHSSTRTSSSAKVEFAPLPAGYFSGLTKLLLRIEGVSQKSIEALCQFLNLRGIFVISVIITN